MAAIRRRQFISFAVVCLVVGFCGAVAGLAAEAGENLLQNSSFERADGQKPADWSTTTWGGRADFGYASVGRTGSRSVMIESADGADASWSQMVTVKPYYRYRLSAWIKTENVERSEGGRGALLNVHNMQSVRTEAVRGTTDWTQVATEFEATGGTLQINCLFGGWGNATGKAWFDDVELTVLEKVEHTAETIEAALDRKSVV